MEKSIHSLDIIQRHVQKRTFNSNISEAFQWELYSAFLDPENFEIETFLQFDIEEILEYIKSSHSYFISFSRQELANMWLINTNSIEVRQLLNTYLQSFLKFDTALIAHIKEEDERLIPYAEMLLKYKKSSTIDYTLEEKLKLIDFIITHDDMPERELKSLANDLVSQSNMSLRVLGEKLDLLWRDLIVHGRIEDEVLLVKLNELEKLL